MKTPASVYVPSQRQYEKPRKYDYPSDAKMVKINNWGYLRFGPIQLYLSETMKDTYLEVRPGNDDTFRLFYRNYQIAVIDAAEKNLINRHIRKV